jgi:hypothetical protein
MQLHARACGQEPADGAQAAFGLPSQASNVERANHRSKGRENRLARQT